MASLPRADGLELDDLSGPFQPKPYDSVINIIYKSPANRQAICARPNGASVYAVRNAQLGSVREQSKC